MIRNDDLSLVAFMKMQHGFLQPRFHLQAERKSYPTRWIIVVITLLSTFLLLIFCIILYDRSKGFFRRQAEVHPASTNQDRQNQ